MALPTSALMFVRAPATLDSGVLRRAAYRTQLETASRPPIAQFRVESIPYFVLLRGGVIIAERAGVTPRAEMRRWFAMPG